MYWHSLSISAIVVRTGLLLSIVLPARAQVSFEQPPIDYLAAKTNDPVVHLQRKIDAGEVKLEFEKGRGYLASVLKHLNVPPSSQGLVYSKTSFQLRRISPRTPRAVYFSDDVYIGWVKGGDVMEVSAVDPHLGANYYTLDQVETAQPQFTRQTHDCLQCHGSSLTRNVPGHMVRSVYSASDGQPVLRAGTHLSDHTSPLIERWGGWYVTGTHGKQRHLGNVLVRDADNPRNVDTEAGANVTDLSAYFESSAYLSGLSDIVALLVLEHQTTMHNVITQANFLTRIALRDEQVMNEMLGRPVDHRSDSTKYRIRSAAEPVVKYLLFSEEFALTDPIAGTSSFTEDFVVRGPRDPQGRSLREFDLKTRIFKYPCSYLIYSEAFDALPQLAKECIYQRLDKILSGQDTTNDFRHLSTTDRQAIREILIATKPEAASHW